MQVSLFLNKFVLIGQKNEEFPFSSPTKIRPVRLKEVILFKSNEQ